MNNHTTIGVDLAKNVIAIVRLSKSGKVFHSKELSRRKFREYLATQEASLVAFEACATAHYWSRVARSFGHDSKILPALSVAPFRQGHKTDINDALAVAEAANRPNIKEAPFKTLDQQTVQAIQRSREILVSERTTLSNHIRGILLEFGFALRQAFIHYIAGCQKFWKMARMNCRTATDKLFTFSIRACLICEATLS